MTSQPESREIVLPPHRFWITRTGSGTAVVLIHGLGGSSDWWRRNVEALAESHTVTAVDLVGFGRNRFFLRRSSLPLVFDDIAALLVRWIENEFHEPVHLVGNSMGGQIAIHIAASRPDLVRSLTLVDSTGIPFALDPRAHVENLIVPRGMLSFALVLARDLFRAGPTSIALAFSRLLLDDARPLMHLLRIPVLLLWGEHDPLVPLTYAEQMQREIPQARLVVIPHAGHVPMWENATRFNAELLGFLHEVDHDEGRKQKAEDRSEIALSVFAFTWGLAGWRDGIAWREAGRRRDIVLIHGLGMSSAYFVRLARELFERGWNPIAPDLPGFGESANAAPMTPRGMAEVLARWADALEIRNAVWLGHSNGCHAVAQLQAMRPDLVRRSIFVGPLWTRSAHPTIRAALRLIADAFREPFALYPYILRAYWRTGLARWLGTWNRDVRDFAATSLPHPCAVVIGRRDPIPDRGALHALSPDAWHDVESAHACVFSNPEAVRRAVPPLPPGEGELR